MPDPTPLPETKFHFEAIAELEAPMKKIIESMGDSLPQYDLILGEDASGRIPTLVFSEFLKRVKGKRVPTYFYSPGHKRGALKRRYVLQEYFGRILAREHPTKPLIVTDYISSGRTMRWTLDAMKQIGMKPDVVAMARYGNYDKLNDRAKVWSGGRKEPSVYDAQSFKGVYQVGDPNTPIASVGQGMLPRLQDINRGREDAKLLADRLYEWWSERQSSN